MNPGKVTGQVNLDWNDDDVLPAVLSLDTEFVFQRMTERTLQAAQSRNGHRVLDVGCGRGIDAVSLAERGGILFGCEPSRIMIRKAKEWIINSGEGVKLVRGLAEDLPFRNHAFARVVCKGAIDHFGNPDLALAEMCRVVVPQGKVIISVANFESLSCSWARKLNLIYQRLLGREIPRPHIWEVPTDHAFKFDYVSVITLAQRYMQIEKVQGASLFWGFPRWSSLLQIFPRGFAFMILKVFDRIASWHPAWGDVLILRGKPRRNFSERERSSPHA
jgi:SAM-dependent methyltransferase